MKKLLQLPYIFLMPFFIFILACGGDDEPKSKEAKISKFQFTTDGSKPATIKGTNITYTFPYGANVTNLKASITISDKATISPKPEEARSYTKPVKFTVIAEDGTTQEYTVTVSVAKNPEAQIKTFTLNGKKVTVDQTN